MKHKNRPHVNTVYQVDTGTEDFMIKKQNRVSHSHHMSASSCLFQFKFHSHSPPSVCFKHANSAYNHRQVQGAAVNSKRLSLTTNV
jgi:hypothetical protein